MSQSGCSDNCDGEGRVTMMGIGGHLNNPVKCCTGTAIPVTKRVGCHLVVIIHIIHKMGLTRLDNNHIQQWKMSNYFNNVKCWSLSMFYLSDECKR